MYSSKNIRTVVQIAEKNLLLLFLFCAIAIGLEAPASPAFMDAFNINTPLVALIFLIQGLNMDFSKVGKVREYSKMLLFASLIAIVLYPAMASGMADLFHLSNDFKVGFILLCCFPSSLEASMAMTMNARGDVLTAVILVIALNLIGIISIPVNITIWLGSASSVSVLSVLNKLLIFVFIPVFIGQMIRKKFPALPDRITTFSHYLPVICLAIIVYLSCSREADLMHQLKLHDVLHLLWPSASVHLLAMGLAFLVAKYVLHFSKAASRSFLFISSEKPMSLSVAVWSVTYASEHPAAIFPILIFYITQMIIDSFIISQMNSRDAIASAPQTPLSK